LQTAYINRVATAVPPYDVHDAFRCFAQSLLNDDRRNSLLFQRMADKDRAPVIVDTRKYIPCSAARILSILVARSIASPNLFRAPAGQLRQAGS
jgi:hypothetical protein